MNQHFDHAVCRLIASAASCAPASLSDRLQEEWLADLRERGDPLARLWFALGCWWAAVTIRHEGITAPVLVSAVAVPAPLAMPFSGRRRPLYSRTQPDADEPTICEINTTPLIDVLLVLLITLILSLPMLTHAVQLDLPRPQPVTQTTPEVIDLDVDFDGTVDWNGTPVADMATLEGYLRNETQKDPQPELHIRANSRVKYDVVAGVLAAAQRNGMRRVGIVNTVQFAQ